MKVVTLVLSIVYIFLLMIEYNQNSKRRKKFKHVIHVNGTRGKSSTCRLIYAALKVGGYKVFCKTTGTSARTIGVDGNEKEIIRSGSPNIKEQIKILKNAEKQGAEIVVIECMAVNPELQYVSQNRILGADISVVTNVREDHLEEMGSSLEDICVSMGNTMPWGGYFITAEKKFYEYYREKAKAMGTKAILAIGNSNYNKIDFSENVAIALKVCKILGVDEQKALEGMSNYQKDPGVLKIYKFYTYSEKEVLFINGFALNDPESTVKTYLCLDKKGFFAKQRFITLLNNRRDRPYRSLQHIDILKRLSPNEIWLCGSHKQLIRRKLIKNGFIPEQIKYLNIEKLDFYKIGEPTTIFGIGNVHGCGEKILGYVQKVGKPLDL